uniref:Uncharacterized protein n=1 Tax=Arundo donax TaxID=35708 RepID=A0A0A9FAN2_ARUDO
MRDMDRCFYPLMKPASFLKVVFLLGSRARALVSSSPKKWGFLTSFTVVAACTQIVFVTSLFPVWV